MTVTIFYTVYGGILKGKNNPEFSEKLFEMHMC